ncbi:hypothetical protein [Halococcus hamelinensis]|nr:hypothetical protein [Halococcus hamelinensis]
MSALALLTDLGALFVLMYAVYVVVRFITGRPKRFVDSWEREELGGESR